MVKPAKLQVKSLIFKLLNISITYSMKTNIEGSTLINYVGDTPFKLRSCNI